MCHFRIVLIQAHGIEQQRDARHGTAPQGSTWQRNSKQRDKASALSGRFDLTAAHRSAMNGIETNGIATIFG